MIRKAVENYKIISLVRVPKVGIAFIFSQPINDQVYLSAEQDELFLRRSLGYHLLFRIGQELVVGPISVIRFINKHPEKIQVYAKEFSIQQVFDSVQSNPSLTLIRKFFRKFGLLCEPRGKTKSKSVDKKWRDKEIIKIYKGLEKKKPLPSKRIIEILTKAVEKKFPDDDGKFGELVASPSTIKRVLESFIKK